MKRMVISLAAGVLALTALPALAAAQGSYGNSWSAGEAKDARDKGDIVPLKDIFRSLKRKHGGIQVDANLFNQDGRQVYVIDWQTEKGERLRFTVDAKSGRVLSTR